MTEELETLLEQAARARRFAIVLHGDPAAADLEQYAEKLEQEIHRLSTEGPAAIGACPARQAGAG